MISPASSSPPTCCPPTWSAPRCMTSGRPRWCSGPDRCSPSCCWPTRSTGPRRKPRRRCSRRWARARSAWTGRPAGCREPFIVLATDNPIEYEGTYELPEAQLDRFLMRLRLGYLTAGDETDMLRRRVDRASESVELDPSPARRGCSPCGSRWSSVEISPGPARLHRGDRHRDQEGPAGPGRRQPARRARAGAAGPRPGACSSSATTWSPTTSSRWRCPRWRTGSPCGPSCGSGRSPPTTWWPSCSRPCPRRKPIRPRGRAAATGPGGHRLMSDPIIPNDPLLRVGGPRP